MATGTPHPMTPFFFLFSFLLIFIRLTHSKFAFSFLTDFTKSTCSLSGVRTVHLPKDHQTPPSPLHLRVLLPSSSSANHASSIDFFDANSQRLGRLEFIFLLNHLQISFNSLQSPWLPLATTLNTLEIKDLSAIQSDIKFNGKRISPAAFIPEPSPTTFKITYHDNLPDPSLTLDSDWIDLIQDHEISSLLLSPIQWQPPVKSVERLTNDVKSKDSRRAGSEIDSIVFDETLSVQLASGQPLPKLPAAAQSKKRTISLSKTNYFSLLSLLSRNPTNLPVYTQTQSRTNSQAQAHSLWIIIILAFTIYLGVLVKLSQMTSIRKAPVCEQTQPQTALTSTSPLSPSASKSSTSVSPLSVSKSPSRTLTFSFPGISSSSSSIASSPAVLKVSVPAAFSLADNRHIIFPSKLRNFQK